MQDLIFVPLHLRCHECCVQIQVSIESLDDNEEIKCPECGLVFTPNIDVDLLLKLMKQAENSAEQKNEK